MEQAPILNRYRPLFIRGRGGFANVQVAWDSKLQRRVAIKHIPLQIHDDKSEGIEEARTAALLNNPNIVAVYDFETTNSEALIIMENVDGPTLTELMAASSELLDIDTISAILDGIVAALDFAHENQVLHLDIKPANVLIDHSGHIKVSDFGLAELAGEAGFGEPQGGTIGYMSPEQLEMGQVDARTDLWALAALSYQLLTGDNPFFALSAAASLAHIVDEPLVLPSALREELDDGADQALVKALDADITERQSSVTAFWTQLHPYLGKVAPGRRTLKRLVQAWSSREQDEMIAAGDAEGAQGDDVTQRTQKDGSPALLEEDDYQNNYQAPMTEENRPPASTVFSPPASSSRAPSQPRQPSIPFWDRTPAMAKTFFARLFSALGSGSMAWLGLSGVAYLSRSVATAATALATSTASPVYAESEFSLIIRIALTAAIALCAFLAPSLGAGLAVLSLSLGIFFTGNWLIGILVLAICIAWWVCIGRRSVADATVLTFTPLLSTLMIPALLPLLAGYFENWRRALGTSLTAGILACLLMLITAGHTGGILAFFLDGIGPTQYGLLPNAVNFDLLQCSLNLMQAPPGTELWLPLVTLVTTPQFWVILSSWLIAAVLMSTLCSRGSRASVALASLLAALVLAAGNVLVPILLWGGHSVLYLIIVTVGLSLALVICLIMAIGAVPPQPGAGKRTAKSKK